MQSKLIRESSKTSSGIVQVCDMNTALSLVIIRLFYESNNLIVTWRKGDWATKTDNCLMSLDSVRNASTRTGRVMNKVIERIWCPVMKLFLKIVPTV